MSDTQDIQERQEVKTVESNTPVDETADFEVSEDDSNLVIDHENHEVVQAPEKEKPVAEKKESAQDESKDKKTRFQKRIDQLVSERETAAFEAEKLKKEIAALKSQKEKPAEEPLKNESDFDTYDEWLDYLQEREEKEPNNRRDNSDEKEKPKEEESASDTQEKKQYELTQEQQAAHARLRERFSNLEEKPADFFDVIQKEDVMITPSMLEELAECDNADKVAYYLGKNPDVAKDIANRSVAQQMRSIAKLDLTVSSYAVESKPSPVSQKITNAPDPISPVSGMRDATPKKLSDMSYSEYESRRLSDEAQANNGGW